MTKVWLYVTLVLLNVTIKLSNVKKKKKSIVTCDVGIT